LKRRDAQISEVTQWDIDAARCSGCFLPSYEGQAGAALVLPIALFVIQQVLERFLGL
jgi:hypothetical protein